MRKLGDAVNWDVAFNWACWGAFLACLAVLTKLPFIPFFRDPISYQ